MTAKLPFAAYLGPEHPHWNSTLADGTRILIRPVGTEDCAAERAFIEGLSPQSRRNRVPGQTVHPSAGLIDRMTDIDQVDDVALAAIAPHDDGCRIIGVSRYAVDPSRRSCKGAVVVAHDWQGKGLGKALMWCLTILATERGLLTMRAFDVAENWQMWNLASTLGFHSRTDPEDSRQVVHTMSLAAHDTPRPWSILSDLIV